MKIGKRLLWASLAGMAIAGEASALAVYGVTTVGNSLVRFDSASPGTINSTVAVTGLGPVNK